MSDVRPRTPHHHGLCLLLLLGIAVGEITQVAAIYKSIRTPEGEVSRAVQAREEAEAGARVSRGVAKHLPFLVDSHLLDLSLTRDQAAYHSSLPHTCVGKGIF